MLKYLCPDTILEKNMETVLQIADAHYKNFTRKTVKSGKIVITICEESAMCSQHYYHHQILYDERIRSTASCKNENEESCSQRKKVIYTTAEREALSYKI